MERSNDMPSAKCHSATDHSHVGSKYTCTVTSLTAVGLAQSVKRLTAEREVVGSILRAGPLLRVLK